MNNILAVDGNSLAHRAYHAIVRDDPEGADWVTGGLVRMLATAWTEGPYDGVLIGFDGRGNRRRELFDGYKANRPDKDPELVAQLERLPGHLDRCGFHVIHEDGIEADDVLAAAADACRGRGWRCDVVSSDRDLVAVVCDTVRLLRPRATMSDLKVYDPDTVLAEFGVRPEQYTDFAALRGDPSDGLPGVNGIGPKTAARLLRDHGDVPGIYRALANVPPRVEALLRAGRDVVERNLLLMAPLPNLIVDVAAAARGVDPDAVDGALLPLGLGRAAGIFRNAIERPPLPPLPPPPHAAPDVARPRVEDHPTIVVTVPDSSEQPSLF